jgi:hypothetical protein
MAALAVQSIVDAGTAPTFSNATASFTVDVGSGSNTVLIVKNGSGSSVTLGISVPGKTTYGVNNPAVAVTVAASGEAWLPLRKAYQGADTPGIAAVTLTGTLTSVTYALVRLA